MVAPRMNERAATTEDACVDWFRPVSDLAKKNEQRIDDDVRPSRNRAPLMWNGGWSGVVEEYSTLPTCLDCVNELTDINCRADKPVNWIARYQTIRLWTGIHRFAEARARAWHVMACRGV